MSFATRRFINKQIKTKHTAKPIWRDSSCVGLWHASQYDAASDSLINLAGGPVGNARFPGGSNSPTRLLFEGEKYLYLPGVTNNYVSVPDSPEVSITGDMQIDIRLSAINYANGSGQIFVSKHTTTGNQRSFRFGLLAGGAFFLSVSSNGETEPINATVGTPSLTNGLTYWFRLTIDTDNGNGKIEAKTYVAPNNGSNVAPETGWTLVGTHNAVNAMDIFDSTQYLEIGASGGSSVLNGVIYAIQMYNGINGAKVLDIDFNDAAEPYQSFTCSTGQTVTINRSTSGLKSVIVDRDLLLFGTNDYLTISDHKLLNYNRNNEFSVFVVTKIHNNIIDQGGPINKKANNSTTNGWALSFRQTNSKLQVFLGDGTNSIGNQASGTIPIGDFFLAGLSIRETDFSTFINGDETTGSLSNLNTTNSNDDVIIGRTVGSIYSDMEFICAGIFARALTADEMNLLYRQLVLQSFVLP